MVCQTCSQPSVLSSALGKDFYYCRGCKTETILAPVLPITSPSKPLTYNRFGYKHSIDVAVSPNRVFDYSTLLGIRNMYSLPKTIIVDAPQSLYQYIEFALACYKSKLINKLGKTEDCLLPVEPPHYDTSVTENPDLDEDTIKIYYN